MRRLIVIVICSTPAQIVKQVKSQLPVVFGVLDGLHITRLTLW